MLRKILERDKSRLRESGGVNLFLIRLHNYWENLLRCVSECVNKSTEYCQFGVGELNTCRYVGSTCAIMCITVSIKSIYLYTVQPHKIHNIHY